MKDESTKEDLNIVHPNLQKAKLLPFIRFKSKSLKFCVEDDPFETELGMIYQLGKVEQRKDSNFIICLRPKQVLATLILKNILTI